ncbi:glycosyltransferase family 4 protein [Fulvivirgaceae bacterium BMA12]|uniref:Glycosyltransferase family 4 protein n=1 Tax=Agaribacillus aureus TaxID=3051825 RepID=A0ABT8L8Y4_9BACT|nr:glycosyltransferase family 4 protein [Fulvivirgaceae bacterium BMA12]
MNKVLIITYYWPPHAGVGVQRWLKFSKYLPGYNWEPVIFTPENAAFDLQDNSLAKEIPDNIDTIRFPIWEPFSIFNKITRGRNKKNLQQGLVLEKKAPSWKDKLFIWLRGNLFIPDPRVFWVKPSVRFLEEMVKNHNYHTVITTGPPHSMHLIGLGLKKKCNIRWIADFRDPWSNWDLLNKLKVSSLSRSFHRRLEKKVLTHADVVLTVSNRLARDLTALGAKNTKVITNGVDVDQINLDFSQPNAVDKFRISYVGLLNELRDPGFLWEGLSELILENPHLADEIEFNLAGIVSESILTRLENDPVLKKVLNYKSYIAHEQVFEEIRRSAVLLVILNKSDNAKWIIPGKLYEYLIARRKILLIGPPESDAEEILQQTKAGENINFGDKLKLKETLLHCYENYKSGRVVMENTGIDKYSRKMLTGELAKILDKEK